MNTKHSDQEIIELYVARVTFKVWHRLIFFGASIAAGFWCLGPLFFTDEQALCLIPPVFGMILLWLAIALPKHFAALNELKRREVHVNQFLRMRCAYAVVKPTESDLAQYPWLLPAFYASLVIPFVCFGVTFIARAL